jgi:hypothetical protein
VTFPLSRTALQSLVLTLLPHGGQRAARRNAWAAMSEGNVRAKGRREAAAVMTRAVSMSQHPAATAR